MGDKREGGVFCLHRLVGVRELIHSLGQSGTVVSQMGEEIKAGVVRSVVKLGEKN